METAIDGLEMCWRRVREQLENLETFSRELRDTLETPQGFINLSPSSSRKWRIQRQVGEGLEEARLPSYTKDESTCP